MLFESTDEDVVHRNVCLFVNKKSRILFVHSFKEKSQFSKSDKNEIDIKQPDTKITIKCNTFN